MYYSLKLYFEGEFYFNNVLFCNQVFGKSGQKKTLLAELLTGVLF